MALRARYCGLVINRFLVVKEGAYHREYYIFNYKTRTCLYSGLLIYFLGSQVLLPQLEATYAYLLFWEYG